ncbi:MAG: SCP2 sterol-binding domain-containing protein [Candidatus Helarchaeales archaeon]
MGAVDEVKELIEKKEFDPKKLPLFLKAVEEVAASNEDLQEELEDQEDVIIAMEVPGVVAAYMEIKDGKLTAAEGMPDNPTVTVQMNEDVATGLLTGEVDTASAYMAGDIKIVGEMAKAMALRSILEIVGEELGLDMGG